MTPLDLDLDALGRIACEPFDDVKPRRWETDYEKLARFHQKARALLARIDEGREDGHG